MSIVASGQLTLVDLNDSKQLQLFISSTQPKTQIFDPNNNTYNPNWTSNKPVLTPQLFIAGTSENIIAQAKTINWYEGTSTTPISSNTNYTVPTTGVKTLTINTNILSNKNSQLFVCEVVYTDTATGFDITIKSDFEFVKVTNGRVGDNAIMALLTNETHTIPTDSAGNNGVFTGANTTMVIYEGATDVSSSWTVTAGTPVGITGSLSGKTYTVATMSADIGHIDLTASRSGYASITKRFTLSKNKQGNTGNNGNNATAYWLISSVPAIAKSEAGVYTPSNITVTAKSATGTSAPANYSGRFRIWETTDGTNWGTAKYTSSTNQATYTYTPSANIKAVKVELFLAGGTTTLLDEAIIPIVSDGNRGADGADGVNAVVGVVTTPNGNVIKNDNGTLTAYMTVYNGSAEQTSGVTYQWYAKDPSVSTNQGGGIGWRKLDSANTNGGTTGWTTRTLTIPSTAIASLESYKCIAQYGGRAYEDTCTVMDVTDPIQITIIGTSIFKNGEGSNSYTARLFREGVEIDSDGTGYVYTWSLYLSNGNKSGTFSKTGKSITVASSDFVARANLVCEITKA
ncbi:tail protein [Bacillus phage vB_BcoS-136]|uniref:Uncharacterized protein n=1 Tax=Bacillus phage vB_BcoS-136 TaxID=2419619 RepID=A0A3G3BVI8_9CAUD|nr:tail protein [Bacillus phage vB_BcoS-136]AYP68263.1 hypothetical protein vBBcoS136_00148 [Bacillus phage vB_BcoS-136]